jgi:DNA-binding transcriptional MerR regulator
MKMLTVRQVAKISGVSIRALHHYDEIGLLKPASTGRNGYRYYGRDELLRLQQILLHRELDIPLGDIRAILDDPEFDQLEALRQQREKLAHEAKRYAQLVRTIDRTIADLNGDSAMKNAELYKGISAEKQAEYEKWLVNKYGGDMPEHIAISKRKYESLSQAEKDQLNTDLQELEAAWAVAMKNGVPADSPSLDPLLSRFRGWVSAMWNRPCPPEAFSGLADLHLGHPDFVSRYDALGEGFSDYHAAGMKAYAKRLAA